LVRRRLFRSRSAARLAINEGQVQVGGIVTPKAATLVDAETPLEVLAESSRYVSRGGEKLAHALTVFEIDASEARAIDLGASTGGFTDCLLQSGARQVVAVDVGYGQLDFRLREDERVWVLERTNVRFLEPSNVDAPFDLVVGDLSFISLELVMDVIAGLVGAEGRAVLLIKPQFEVGRAQVGRGGVVEDPRLWRQAIQRIVAAGTASGLRTGGLTLSPLRGASSGNREFLVLLQPGPETTLDSGELDRALEEAVRLGEPLRENQ
jgi:23S rRNA (cytidine1920-2'-O)/16S rRNA (cytidine1409-2'-O)-methyltransferase